MKVKKSTRIGVLLGGLSKEREVSLRTGQAFAKALRNLSYESVIEIDAGRDLAEVLRRERIGVAAITLHGRFGEDGSVQGVLEYLGIPYTGTGVLGSAVAMDKVLSKELFEHYRIPTPPSWVAGRAESRDALIAGIEKRFGFPAIAKPPCEGSTLGFSLVRDPSEVEAAQRLSLQFGDTVLWEKCIQGTELTVGFLGGEALPLVEIVPKSGRYDYESKYTKGKTEYFCPARVSAEVSKRTQEVAAQAFAAVQGESFGRVDVLWADDTPWVLEVNTIPGMTETSLLPKAAAAAGISFDEMAERILQAASLKIGRIPE